MKKQLELLDQVKAQIRGSERQIESVVKETLAMQLLMNVPVIEMILAVVIVMQVGDVNRFSNPENLASYAVTVLPVKASEDKLIHSPVWPDVNRYLKWALTEAANTIATFHKRWIGHHVAFIYLRFREKKGHAKALAAVARHLAEPTFLTSKKAEPYREKTIKSLRRLTRSKRKSPHETSNLENCNTSGQHAHTVRTTHRCI